MPKRMLIDASHPEETRVVVFDGQKVEEFDFEAASKRPLKGNIYLAKVTRVEPSLQAAFVDYGGNRQGFLAFSEIHPDYYQIPVADRMALLAEQEAEVRHRVDDEFESFETARPAQGRAVSKSHNVRQEAETSVATELSRALEDVEAPESAFGESAERSAAEAEEQQFSEGMPQTESSKAVDDAEPQDLANGDDSPDDAVPVEDQRPAATQRPPQRWVRRRHYKIQEVIRRRQVILVQVVKEERGNKGAALTTYLSLAGRYCVLMPNTPRGGGISRKITNANDRKRLKSAAQSLELPEGMGLIIRTAGENRTKAEIKRDYEYLLRMWDTIREITLKSNAPACVYEEGDLIKRAIRDLYNKDVSEIVVEGDEGYRNAKDFMRMLMPSHAKNVKQYKEPISLYQRFHIEAQLDAMFSPTVTLKSGGYIVINQTEALVAVDVNSGRATREHSIEDTAYKTNLEAAEEIARQLRLRDLAGLIVIDFIDMEDVRNDRNVEKRLRDCVKNDRARVQIGKISQFGLLEMSRQRLRAGVVAGSTIPCPTCAGQGLVRSVESTALRLLRALDEEGQRRKANSVIVHVPLDVAMYTLNQKRREIARMEQEYGLAIAFQPKSDIQAGTFEMERVGHRAPEDRGPAAPSAAGVATALPGEARADEREEAAPAETQADEYARPESQSQGDGRRRRRRRRRGRDRGTQPPIQKASSPPVSSEADDSVAEHSHDEDELAENGPSGAELRDSDAIPSAESSGKRRRRRRRRGRRPSSEAGNFNGRPDSLFQSEDTPDAIAEDHSRETGAMLVPSGGETLLPSGVAPNAPSAPLWSLFSTGKERNAPGDNPRMVDSSLPSTSEDIPTAAAPAEAAEAAPESGDMAKAPAEMPAAGAAEPARKGWWQRPFRLRD